MGHIKVAYYIPVAAHYCVVRATTFTLFGAAYCVMIWLPEWLSEDASDQKWIRMIFLFAESFIATVVTKYQEQSETGMNLPVHTELQHERYCLFTVLVMGESILGIILPELSQTEDYLATVAACCVLIFALQYLYFEVDNFRYLKHAVDFVPSSGHAWSRWLFPSLHAGLFITQLIMGVGVKCALYYNTKLKQKYRYLLCFTFSINILISMAIHCCHKLPKFELGIKTRVGVRFIGAMIGAGLGCIPYGDLSVKGLTWSLASVGICLLFFEFYAAHIPEETDQRQDFIEDEEEAYVEELRESMELALDPNSPADHVHHHVDANRVRMTSRGVVDYHVGKGSSSIGMRQSMRVSMRTSTMVGLRDLD